MQTHGKAHRIQHKIIAIQGIAQDSCCLSGACSHQSRPASNFSADHPHPSRRILPSATNRFPQPITELTIPLTPLKHPLAANDIRPHIRKG